MKNIFIAALVMLSVIGCSKKPNEVVKPSGIRYVEDSLGTGREVKKDDRVSIHFQAYVIKDSTLMDKPEKLYSDWSKDSTHALDLIGDTRMSGGPYEFNLNSEQFIKGSDEGIVGMKKGGRRTLIIPYKDAYGDMGGAGGRIPPRTNIKVVVTLVDAKDKVVINKWDVDSTKLQTTKSGLKYYILKEGTGAKIDSGKVVVLNYSGFLADGKMFDSSVERQQPVTFQAGVNKFIAGWEEGIKMMNKGSKVRLVIPPALGYKDQPMGVIPPNSTLYFDVEVVDVK